MEQFTMTLNENFQRPMIYLSNWYGLNALLDTGALFPVWTAKEEVLRNLGGILIKKNIKFLGFGGEATGNLYRVQRISIGKLIFPEMSILSCNKLNYVPYHIILSATMFHHLIYEIDSKNHKLNITIPDGESIVRVLKIEDSNGNLHILCQ